MKYSRRLVRKDRRRLYIREVNDSWAEIRLRPQGVRLG
jgi:hypothetical protein